MRYLIPFEDEETASLKDCSIANKHFGGFSNKTTSIFVIDTINNVIGLVVPSDEYSNCFTKEEWNSRIIIEDEY
jgi:hypothetical protein